MTSSRWRWACGAAVAVQLAVLYWPSATVGGGVVGVDKLVHLAVFGAVGLTAVIAGARGRVVLSLLVAHAVLSEIVQHRYLAGRSGDAWDVVADVVGAVAGVALGVARRRPPGR